MQGEAASADAEVAASNPGNLANIMQEQQIFKVNETFFC